MPPSWKLRRLPAKAGIAAGIRPGHTRKKGVKRLMERGLALEFVRVTEAAALNSAKWMGKGDKHKADDAAVQAMRAMFDTMNIRGKVVIGEGEMDEAPMLYIGEEVGLGWKPAAASLTEEVTLAPAFAPVPLKEKLDIAVDPLEGTNLVAKGMPGAIAVMAVTPENGLLHAPDMYMEKICVGPGARGCIDINASVEDNVRNVARALGKAVEDLTVVILDRQRHEKQIEALRRVGARVRLITDGDVSPAVAAAMPDTGIDMMIGRGGAPEGVIAAAALKALGGDMQARLWAENPEELRRVKEMGISNIDHVLTLDDLVRTDDVIFTATGITDSELLPGVRFHSRCATTKTLVIRGITGTVRFIEAHHYYETKPKYVKMEG